MSGKKENDKMAVDTKFIEKNKEKIKKIAEANTKKNKDGLTVLDKNDPWREETEWDQLYKELKDKK